MYEFITKLFVDYRFEAIGYIFGVLVASLFIECVARALQKKVKLPRHDHIEFKGTVYLPRILGLVERTLFIAAIQEKHEEFIGVWLALKVAGQWKAWAEGIKEPSSDKNSSDRMISSGRSIFNIFLVGSGLSLAYAFVGAKMIEFGESSKLTELVLLPGLLVVATGVLIWYIPRAGKWIK